MLIDFRLSRLLFVFTVDCATHVVTCEHSKDKHEWNHVKMRK